MSDVATTVTTDRLETDRSLVSGVAWTAGVRWAIQVVSWLSTLIVARLLSPADYGLIGMAMVYLGLIQLVSDFGIGGAIIQRRALTRDQVARLGGFSIALGFGFVLVSAAVAGPIAAFYRHPPVRDLIIVLSLGFLITGTTTVPRALLYRDLQFRKLAWIEGLEAVVLTASTLTLALLGARYWSLAAGSLIAKTISSIVVNAWRPHRVALPMAFRTIASEVTMGGQVAGATVAWYLYENADFAVVGRLMGDHALGLYTIGWTIATIPVEKIAALLQRVTFSVFSKVQHDPDELRRYVRMLTEGLAFLAFPAAVGLALVADRLVVVALGAKWADAAAPLRILALYGGFRTLATLFPQVLVAVGRARLNFYFNLVALTVLPVIFAIGTRWGTAGVAAGWVVGYPLIVVPFFMRSALKVIRMSFWDYFKAIWPALSGSAIMGLAVLLIRETVSPSLPIRAAFALEVIVGAMSFAGVSLAFHRDWLRSHLNFFRSLRGAPAS